MADNFSLKAILSAVDNLSPVLKGVQGVAKSTRKYLGDLGGSVNALTAKFGVPLGILSTIAAGFGVAAIKKAVVDFADLGEEVMKGAVKAGMSNAEYQKMKYVFDQAGVSIESMQGSMGKLNKNLGNAGKGKNDDLVQLLKVLHIPLRNANGQIRTASDLLPQLSEAFVKNKDPVKQAAIGTALFGKSWAEMAPMLNEGSEGMARSLARFDKLKGVIGDDDLKGAKEFGDQLKDLSFVTKGFQMTIAKELVPVLSPMLEDFIQWAAVNKKLIGSEVKKVVQQLVAAVKSVDWGAFVAGVGKAFDGIGRFVEMCGGLRNVLIGLAVIMNAQTIMAILGIGGAVGRLGIALLPLIGTLGTLTLAAWPFLLVAALLAGAAYLIYRNWDAVGPFLGQIWERIKATAEIAWNALRFLFSWSPLGIIVNNWGAITAWAGLFWQNLTALVQAGVALIGGVLQSWGVLDMVKAVWEPVVAFFRGVWDYVGGIVSSVVNAAGKVTNALGSAAQAQFGAGASNQAFGPRLDGPGASLASAMPLTAPATQVGGSVSIDFKNAPPGMTVAPAQASNPRVPISTNVGYRTLGNDMGF